MFVKLNTSLNGLPLQILRTMIMMMMRMTSVRQTTMLQKHLQMTSPRWKTTRYTAWRVRARSRPTKRTCFFNPFFLCFCFFFYLVKVFGSVQIYEPRELEEAQGVRGEFEGTHVGGG